MSKPIKFDVFGRLMSVERKNDGWLLFSAKANGLKTTINEIVIPGDLDETELEKFLDDMYHEFANVDNPSVIRI